MPPEFTSFSVQDNSTSVTIEYQLNGSTYVSILNAIQVYSRTSVLNSIDNYFVLMDTISKSELIASI